MSTTTVATAMMLSVREDEPGAEMRGIDTTLVKLTAFTLAAVSTGVVGGMWAYQNTFIEPDAVFLDGRTIGDRTVFPRNC